MSDTKENDRKPTKGRKAAAILSSGTALIIAVHLADKYYPPQQSPTAHRTENPAPLTFNVSNNQIATANQDSHPQQIVFENPAHAPSEGTEPAALRSLPSEQDSELLVKARDLENSGHFGEAEGIYQHLDALSGKAGAEVAFHHGEILLNERRDFVGALDLFRRAIRLDPEYASSYVGLGIALERQAVRFLENRERTKAVELARSAINQLTAALNKQVDPSLVGDAKYALGKSWLIVGNKVKAKQVLTEAANLPEPFRNGSSGPSRAIEELSNLDNWASK